MENLNYDNLMQIKRLVEDLSDVASPHERKNEIESEYISRFSRESGRLAIVVGHTAISPGAFGIAPISANEYAWNKELANRIQRVADLQEVNCRIFFRDGVGIVGAYNRVREWGANAAVELHFNSSDPPGTGTETLYGLFGESRRFAQSVQDEMVRLYERQGETNRGIKLRRSGQRGGINVNQLQNIPSCLVEPFFGNKPTEAFLGDSKKQGLAEAIVSAFRIYIG